MTDQSEKHLGAPHVVDAERSPTAFDRPRVPAAIAAKREARDGVAARARRSCASAGLFVGGGSERHARALRYFGHGELLGQLESALEGRSPPPAPSPREGGPPPVTAGGPPRRRCT